MTKEIGIFGAGCFWGVEESFLNADGVIDTEVGYIGGTISNPSYEDVCRGNTNHAEAVRAFYDSEIITYEDLLDIFFNIHDSTTLNRQGYDIGTQYRSAIFYLDDSVDPMKEVLQEYSEIIYDYNVKSSGTMREGLGSISLG